MSYPTLPHAHPQHQQTTPATPTTTSSTSTSPQPHHHVAANTGPGGAATAIPQLHKRTYQACIPCRQRKVRCDLGSVEAPHAPPCVRCRREMKECYFSPTRRKTRAPNNPTLAKGGLRVGIPIARSDGTIGPKREYEEEEDGFASASTLGVEGQEAAVGTVSSSSYGPRKKLRTESPTLTYVPTASLESNPQRHHHYHHHQHSSHNSENREHSNSHIQQEATVSTTRLLQGEVYNSHDALHLLFEAAGRSSSIPSSPNKQNAGNDSSNDDDENDDSDNGDSDVADYRNGHQTHDNDDTSVEAGHKVAAPAYPGRTEDVDGRLDPIHPHPHFNGRVTSSTSYLRGTGRTPTPKPGATDSANEESHSAETPLGSNATTTSPQNTTVRSPMRNHHQPISPTAHAKPHRPSITVHSATGKVATLSSGIEHEEKEAGLASALKAWGKSRFVRSGWFTAGEAINYVEYFFSHHHPLSPLLTTNYADPSTHRSLLQHEPFLATTLLAIASRYLRLPGPGGHSRSYAIHDMLWRELRRGLESVIWGGGGGGPPSRGGFGGMGCVHGKGLRTLGTVEALMVLTEWHVRNLHFPVGGEGGWGAFDGVFGSDAEDDDEVESHHSGHGSKKRTTIMSSSRRRHREKEKGVVEGLGDRIENILEPAWRSDRMSWMLLGNALSLSYELGVFDDLDEPISSVSTPQSAATPSSSSHAQHGVPPSPAASATTYRLRCRKIQKLFVVYVTQLASRLGWTSMIPKNITDALGYKGQYTATHAHLFTAAGLAVSHQQQIVAPSSITSYASSENNAISKPHRHDGSTAQSSSFPAGQISNATSTEVNGAGYPIIKRSPHELQDDIFQCWVDLTMLMKYAGDQCFPTRASTRDYIRSGKYITLLEQLKPLLRGWKEGFEMRRFPADIHNILTLEYEHVRLYVNSLALQAVIDRCTTFTLPTQTSTEKPASYVENIKQETVSDENEANANKKSVEAMKAPPPSSSQPPSFAAIMQTSPHDLPFLQELVSAARCVLTTAIERMAPSGQLRHAPVRIYLRILSAAMFLLKTFALGAKEDDITVSLELISQTAETLRKESVDDVHLGLRFSDLLETLARRVKSRFIRMAGSRADSPAAASGSRLKGEESIGIGIGLSGLAEASSVLAREGRKLTDKDNRGNEKEHKRVVSEIARLGSYGVDPSSAFGTYGSANRGRSFSLSNSSSSKGSSFLPNQTIMNPDSAMSFNKSSSLMPPPLTAPHHHPSNLSSLNLSPTAYHQPTSPTSTFHNPASNFSYFSSSPSSSSRPLTTGSLTPTFLPTTPSGESSNTATGLGGDYFMSRDGGEFENWLALPLDPIMGFGIDGGNMTKGGAGNTMVTQNQMGPDVGGFDLLELLLSEGGVASSSSGSGSGAHGQGSAGI